MQDRTIALARGRLLAVVAAAVAGAACSPQPAPRSYDFFLNDSIARDGTLARCDRDPAAAHDIECANARRAALAVQLEEERARREALERESAAKIEALRREFEAQRRAREAAAAEEAALAGLAPETGDAEPPDDFTDTDTDAGAAAAPVNDATDSSAVGPFDAEQGAAVPDSAIPRAFRD